MILMRKGLFLITTIFCSLTHATAGGNLHSHFGAQALYLQPKYSGYNQFGVLGNTASGSAPTQLAFQAVNDVFRWGFKIEGAYDFRPENDINLNWSHYNNTTNKGSILVPAGSSFTDALSNVYSSGTILTSRRSAWDAVNAELGQILHVGGYSDLRFHGGVQYARIKTQVSLSEPDVISSTNYSNQTISYSGVGPRLGIDMGYHLIPKLVIYANGAAGILIGPTRFYDTGAGRNTLQLVTGSTNAIVPDLEVKLGVNYTYTLTYGSLGFNLGWMWNNYFSSQVNNHGTDTHESDFGLQGVFFGFVFKTAG